jgi:hypothetical protein
MRDRLSASCPTLRRDPARPEVRSIRLPCFGGEDCPEMCVALTEAGDLIDKVACLQAAKSST